MWGDLPDGVIVQGNGHLGGVVIQVEGVIQVGWSSRWSCHPGGVTIQVEWSSR